MSDEKDKPERLPGGKWAPGKSASPATQFKPGQVANPLGWHALKTRRELRELARASVPKAFERARQILDDDKAEWRAWIEAAKYLTAYGYGSPPKVDDDDKAQAASALGGLSVDELRALARQSLADDAGGEADDADDSADEADETEH